MREGSKQIGKKISRQKKERKFSVMELIDGCTRVHVDNAENEKGLEVGTEENSYHRITEQSSQNRHNF